MIFSLGRCLTEILPIRSQFQTRVGDASVVSTVEAFTYALAVS